MSMVCIFIGEWWGGGGCKCSILFLSDGKGGCKFPLMPFFMGGQMSERAFVRSLGWDMNIQQSRNTASQNLKNLEKSFHSAILLGV